MRNFFLSEQFAYQSRRVVYAEKAGQSAGCRAGKPRGAGTGFGLTRWDPGERGRVRVGGTRRGGENRFADFGTEIPAVSKRIRHVFQSGELEREATVSEMEMVRPMEALQVLRDKFGGSGLFAHEKDESFRSTMGAIYQTFGGRDLYPDVDSRLSFD